MTFFLSNREKCPSASKVVKNRSKIIKNINFFICKSLATETQRHRENKYKLSFPIPN